MAPALFHRILIANRGEVAVRVARACDALGIVPVFAVSDADRDAPYTRGREVVVLGPGRAAQSYLDVERVVQAAVQSRCSALHPGWGFLSENPLLATACAQHGVTFIGPPPHVTALMGSKTRAKAAMRAAGMQVIPGSEGVLAGVDDAKAALADAIRVLTALGKDGEPWLGGALFDMANLELDAKHPGEALTWAEKSLALVTSRPADANALDVAEASFSVARALHDTKGDRTRAKKLMADALKHPIDERRAEMSTWFAANPL